jgi:hypothetical protein
MPLAAGAGLGLAAGGAASVGARPARGRHRLPAGEAPPGGGGRQERVGDGDAGVRDGDTGTRDPGAGSKGGGAVERGSHGLAAGAREHDVQVAAARTVEDEQLAGGLQAGQVAAGLADAEAGPGDEGLLAGEGKAVLVG